jgi:transcriptional regulator with XRE-family HTH domain
MKNLKQLRLNKKLTQTDVAIMCEVSLTSYRLWEIGVQKPTSQNLEKLKKIFEFK